MGLAALMVAVSGTARTSGYLRDKTLAQWIALNRLSEVRLNLNKFGQNTDTGELDFANRNLALRHPLFRHQHSHHEARGGARVSGRCQNQGQSAGRIHRVSGQLRSPRRAVPTPWTGPSASPRPRLPARGARTPRPAPAVTPPTRRNPARPRRPPPHAPTSTPAPHRESTHDRRSAPRAPAPDSR